ncbi:MULTISPECIES: DUF4280 domain-containing protein [Pseudomonas]|uniref:DUF4280 domain-containing protein n=1 Tax=Pseudomonas TaxID=286 RepID=UPI001EF0C836|nr:MULTISPECIES: DUF4280 domain-containing protein [Pseudomonas]
MPAQVVMGASLRCSFGNTQAKLIVLPINRVFAEGQLAASIMDHLPMVNICSFGMCSSLANPQVAAATSAAMGALTPMPCLPVTVTPWIPDVTKTLIGKLRALGSTATCSCTWAGLIQVADPGTRKTLIS